MAEGREWTGVGARDPERHARVMSWNVLAAGLDTTGGFEHVAAAPQSIAFAVRWPALLAEVRLHAPDCLVLQECNGWEQWWQPALRELGYQGDWVSKTSSPAARLGAPPDGCAVLWSTRAGWVPTDAAAPHRYTAAAGGSQVALWSRARRRSDGAQLAVATTHLKAKGDHAAVRARQAQELRSWLVDRPTDVIAGDWNAVPSEPAVQGMLEAGWHSVHPLDGRHWTTWKRRQATGELRHQIDYIWYRGGAQPRWVPVRWAGPLLTLDQGPLPRPGGYPSDHVSQLVDLAPAAATPHW